jgi:hypothetical protein
MKKLFAVALIALGGRCPLALRGGGERLIRTASSNGRTAFFVVRNDEKEQQ